MSPDANPRDRVPKEHDIPPSPATTKPSPTSESERPPFWRAERINQKLTLAFVALFAILAAYGAVTYLAFTRVERNVTDMESDSMLAMQAAHLQRLSETSLDPLRDYVLSGEPAAANRFQSIASDLAEIMTGMGVPTAADASTEGMVMESPAPTAAMEAMGPVTVSPEELGLLQELGGSWEQVLAGAQRIFAIPNPVGNDQALEELRGLQPMAERMSAFAESLHAKEMEDVRLSRESADATTGRTITLLVVAVALAIVISILLSQGIARAISRPIVRLTDQATAISMGDLEATVEVRSKGEVGDLALALERMRTSLKMTIDRLAEEEEDLRGWSAPLIDRELRRKVRGGWIVLGGQRYEVGRDLEGQLVNVRLDLDLREIVVTPASGVPRRVPVRA